MSYEIKSNKLYKDGAAVSYVKSPNVSRGTIKPKFLVIHYTAGMRAAGAISWFSQKRSKVSSQLVLDVDGTWTQCTALNAKAWHAGISRWGNISGLNAHSIGIEVANPGILKQQGDGRWITWQNKVLSNQDQIRVITGRNPYSKDRNVHGWLPFSEDQVRELVEVGRVLHDKYNFKAILGHDEIRMAAGRGYAKNDPGLCIDRDRLRSAIMGRSASRPTPVDSSARHEDDDFVTTDKLNLRRWPGSNSEILWEIPEGTSVDKERHKGGWFKINVMKDTTPMTGWVYAKYLRAV